MNIAFPWFQSCQSWSTSILRDLVRKSDEMQIFTKNALEFNTCQRGMSCSIKLKSDKGPVHLGFMYLNFHKFGWQGIVFWGEK